MSLDEKALESLRMDQDVRDAGTGRAGLIVAVVLAIVAIAGIGYWLIAGNGDEVVVQTTRVRAPNSNSQDGSVLDASGYVVARRLATVSSKVTGKIDEILIEEGMEVEVGQVLARLDASTVKARLALAVDQTNAARRSEDETRVRLEEARRSLKRNQSLREQKLVSEAALDAAQSEVHALEARLAAERSNVEVAQRNVELIEQDLDDLTIRAPFAGIVISKNAQPGEMISPNSAGGGFTRTGICTIVDMDSREIEVEVNEAYINRVVAGQRTEARLDAYPDWTIPSQVINIVPTADRQRATVKVRIGFDELDPRILNDMGAKVRFLDADSVVEIDTENAAVAIVDSRAIVQNEGRDVVWVVRDGTVERRAVSIGRGGGGATDILSGLRPGEIVIVSPQDGLADGMEIKIDNEG